MQLLTRRKELSFNKGKKKGERQPNKQAINCWVGKLLDTTKHNQRFQIQSITCNDPEAF